ncbi:hypothetical protein FMEAI12_4580033 [Parafrankia sp. Ea1.12]|nr:hypothetical protein FMEAI12_4580033 [Parafrankia sp. Ea1.12]
MLFIVFLPELASLAIETRLRNELAPDREHHPGHASSHAGGGVGRLIANNGSRVDIPRADDSVTFLHPVPSVRRGPEAGSCRAARHLTDQVPRSQRGRGGALQPGSARWSRQHEKAR